MLGCRFLLLLVIFVCYFSGMPMGSHKKNGTTFCGKPVCVGDVQCPKGAMTEAQKGLRERNMSLYSVRNYHLGFRRISGVNILVQKKRISTVRWKIGIPVFLVP